MAHHKLTVTALLLFLATGYLPAAGQESLLPAKPTLPSEWIISIHYIVPKEGIKKTDAREYLEKEFLPQFRDMPGVNVLLAEQDRGKLRSEWALIYTFDAKQTRDRYFPAPGVFSDEMNAVIKKYAPAYDKFFTMFDRARYTYVDFVVLGSSKMDAALNVFSFHDFVLVHNASFYDAERFIVSDYFPIFREVPGMNAHFAKAERGSADERYAVIFTLDSRETRDSYYPKPEVFSPFIQNSLRKNAATFQRFAAFFGREHSSADQYADYLVLARAK